MYQIRKEYRRNRIASNLILEFDNPILKEIRDTGGIKDTFSRYPFIPYAGTDLYTSHYYLNLLLDLVDNNPTLNQCIKVIGDFCFNSGQILYHKTNNIFQSALSQEASPAIQQKYTEHIQELNFFQYRDKVDFNHFVKALYFEIKNGNCYVELVRHKLGDVVAYTYRIHPQTQCLYKINKDDSYSLVVSKSFDYNYLRKFPAREVPLYPNVKETDEEVRTMFHFKTRSEGVYGRPDWISCLLNAYNSYQDSLYRVKLSGRDFSPQVLIEVEGDDPSLVVNEKEKDDILESLLDNFTVGGNKASTIMAMERPHGSKSAFVHEFKTNTKEAYYKVVGEINEREIIKANGWSKLLLTGEVPTGFADAPYIDELKNRELSVLKKYHKLISSMLAELFIPYFSDVDPEMNEYEVDFNLPYNKEDENVNVSERSSGEESS